MKVPQLLASVAIAAAFSVTLPAQQAPTGFHSVACIKVKPENNTEFRKWAAEDVHKYAQSRVDAGAIVKLDDPAGCPSPRADPQSATTSSSPCTPESRRSQWASNSSMPH